MVGFCIVYFADAFRNSVATVAWNGATNAGILKGCILGSSDEEISTKLENYH